jgi:hypothetical protein
MPPPDWNEPLARLLESRLVHALDTEARDQAFTHCQAGLGLNLTCTGRGTLHK